VTHLVRARTGVVVVTAGGRTFRVVFVGREEQDLAFRAPVPVVLTVLRAETHEVITRSTVVVATTGRAHTGAQTGVRDALAFVAPLPFVLSFARTVSGQRHVVVSRTTVIVTSAFGAVAASETGVRHVLAFVAPSPFVLFLARATDGDWFLTHLVRTRTSAVVVSAGGRAFRVVFVRTIEQNLAFAAPAPIGLTVLCAETHEVITRTVVVVATTGSARASAQTGVRDALAFIAPLPFVLRLASAVVGQRHHVFA
jgi:hypothetical protein